MALTSVAVIVPWRETDEHRAAAWWHLEQLWERHHPDWELIEGQAPPGPWIKGLAITDGLARTTADILVLADADVWCGGTAEAVEAVAAGAEWAIPHWHVHRLTPEATAAVLAGGPLAGAVERRPYRGFAGGGLTVIRRELLERAPIDPRFVGWGQEDSSAGRAWQTLGGKPWRGRADLWHLWHPPQARSSIEWGSAASRALWRRYRAAAGHPDHMTTLIAQIGQPNPGRSTRPPQHEERHMANRNTWRNKRDGRLKVTEVGTQRDKIFRRHRDWELLIDRPAPPVIAEPDTGSTPTEDEDTVKPVEVVATGSSWFEIRRGDELLDRVNGKAKADARAAELEALG